MLNKYQFLNLDEKLKLKTSLNGNFARKEQELFTRYISI